MTTDGEERFRERLGRAHLPPWIERWRLALAPGDERPTDAAEWAGALVLVETGCVVVECSAGGSETFSAGDTLALGWLPLRRLRNPGPGPMTLLAIRHRDARPAGALLLIRRSEVDDR